MLKQLANTMLSMMLFILCYIPAIISTAVFKQHVLWSLLYVCVPYLIMCVLIEVVTEKS